MRWNPRMRRTNGEAEEGEPFHGHLVQAALDNTGLPMVCMWQNRPKSFSDGGGLCSPGRWLPEDRGTGLVGGDKEKFIGKLALMIRAFVIQNLMDVQKETFRLATGHMKESPFREEAVAGLRKRWFELLGGGAIVCRRSHHTSPSTFSHWKKL